MDPFQNLRYLPAVFLIFACLTPCVSAFTLSAIDVTPRGYQAPGTPMTVNAQVVFSPEGTETFPQGSELKMSTDLVDPYWVPVLVLNGVETTLPQKNGGSLLLPGSFFSYPSTQDVQVKVTLTGKIPVDASPDRNFLRVQEIDSGDTVVSSAHVEMPAIPVTTVSTQKPATKKTFTPLPTDTPTQKSPFGTGAGVLALLCAAFLIQKTEVIFTRGAGSIVVVTTNRAKKRNGSYETPGVLHPPRSFL